MHVKTVTYEQNAVHPQKNTKQSQNTVQNYKKQWTTKWKNKNIKMNTQKDQALKDHSEYSKNNSN